LILNRIVFFSGESPITTQECDNQTDRETGRQRETDGTDLSSVHPHFVAYVALTMLDEKNGVKIKVHCSITHTHTFENTQSL